MRRVIVYHRYYGCETGCCGHAVLIGDEKTEMDMEYSDVEPREDGTREEERFGLMDHPAPGQSDADFVRRMVTLHYGEDHVADIDFEHCIVIGGDDSARKCEWSP
jgi:hypothetical protein